MRFFNAAVGAGLLCGAMALAPSLALAGPFGVKNFGRHAAGVVAGAITQEVVKEVAGESNDARALAAVAGVAVAVGVSGDTSAGSIIGHSLGQAIIAGATSDWFDPHTNRRGRFRVVRTLYWHEPIYYRFHRHYVSTVPPLDLVGGPFVAVKSANVRGGPGSKYAKVDRLTRGEVVEVIAKVRGRNWYLLGRDGVGHGYVYGKLLRPAAADRWPDYARSADPEGDPVLASNEDIFEEKIADNTTCRTIEKTETPEGGEPTSEEFTVCESVGGWTMVDAEPPASQVSETRPNG